MVGSITDKMNPEEEKAKIISEDFTGDGVDTEAGRRKKNSKVQKKQRKKRVRSDENLCLSRQNIT